MHNLWIEFSRDIDFNKIKKKIFKKTNVSYIPTWSIVDTSFDEFVKKSSQNISFDIRNKLKQVDDRQSKINKELNKKIVENLIMMQKRKYCAKVIQRWFRNIKKKQLEILRSVVLGWRLRKKLKQESIKKMIQQIHDLQVEIEIHKKQSGGKITDFIKSKQVNIRK